MFDPRKLMEMFKNPVDMQKNIAEKLRLQKATGEAGGGMVKVVINGHLEIESVSIEESLLKEDKTFVEELIKAAMNDATGQLRNAMADYLKSFTGGWGI